MARYMFSRQKTAASTDMAAYAQLTRLAAVIGLVSDTVRAICGFSVISSPDEHWLGKAHALASVEGLPWIIIPVVWGEVHFDSSRDPEAVEEIYMVALAALSYGWDLWIVLFVVRSTGYKKSVAWSTLATIVLKILDRS